MKILVTGATGFVGGYVIPLLINGGHEVVASSSNIEKAQNCDWFSKVGYKPLNFLRLDDAINYQEHFGNPDALIHLAWEGLPNYKEAFHIEQNLPRHQLFLKNLIENGLQNITVAGTCFEYGMQEGCLHETLPSAPATAYASAKNELRIFLEDLQQAFPFHLKWARLFYMYGRGQHPNSLLSQLDAAIQSGDEVFNMSGGQQVRDFLPVETIAENLVKMALQNQVTGIINNCSGQRVTVENLVKEYLHKQQAQIKLNLGFYPYANYEPMYFWGDTTKLKTILKE